MEPDSILNAIESKVNQISEFMEALSISLGDPKAQADQAIKIKMKQLGSKVDEIAKRLREEERKLVNAKQDCEDFEDEPEDQWRKSKKNPEHASA